jgi:dimethylsulfone monooxygenase
LMAHTKRLNVFGTVLAPLIHPVLAAKQCVTVDLIGNGRFGLNIVCGWNQDEFEMFGMPQLEHDERYVFGQEWWEVVAGIWQASDPFDYKGKYFRLKGVGGHPKPWNRTRPLIMNAGSSTAGRAFAARNCDIMFTALIDHERAKKSVVSIKENAKQEYGRDISLYTSVHIVCRPSRKEAEEYYRQYAIENADNEAVSHLMKLQGLHAQSFPPEVFASFRTRFAGGHGSLPLIGTPDEVVEEFGRVAADGFDGVAFTMPAYLKQLPYFIDEVMPRLARLGLHA